jgi:hypothetical protein
MNRFLVKIIAVLTLAVLFLPSYASANDGGPLLDDTGLLTVEYELSGTEAEIGGTLEFELTLTNNMQYPIIMFAIKQVFKCGEHSTYNTDIFHGTEMGNIEAGKSVTYDISVGVPKSVYWYKEGDNYYFDFDLELLYLGKDIYGQIDGDARMDWEYIKQDLTTVPVKITNLSDGSDMVKLELSEKETSFYFPQYQDFVSHIYHGELFSEAINGLTFTNESAQKIEDLYFYNRREENKDSLPEFLGPAESLTVTIWNHYYLAPDGLPETLPAEYKAVFKSGDKYYAAEKVRQYPAVFLQCPKLSLSSYYSPQSSGGQPAKITVTNTSDEDYENIYLDFSHSQEDYEDQRSREYSAAQIIPVIKKGSTVEIQSYAKPVNPEHYFIALIRDGKMYYWNVDSESNPVFYREGWLSFYHYLNVLEETTPPDAASSPPPSTPSPKLASAQTPPPQTPAAPSMEITSVKKQSSIPFWVWIALGAAVIASGILIFVIKKKGKTESE